MQSDSTKAAIEEFLAAIDDPVGDYRAAQLFSEVRANAYLQRVAAALYAKYKVMPNVLYEAQAAREEQLIANINMALLGL